MKQTLHKTLLLLVALTVSICAKAQDDVKVDGICYILNENTATVTYNEDNPYSGSVVIPETITYNGKHYSVASIGLQAFEECFGLTSITISNSVTHIGNFAFRYCKKLEEVKCFAEKVPETATMAFKYSPIENATLYVEGGSLNAYQTTTPWSNFGTIKPLSKLKARRP